MNLLKNDLFRSFALGFALGGGLLVMTMGGSSDQGLSGQMIPLATAATAAPALPDLTLIDPTVEPAR